MATKPAAMPIPPPDDADAIAPPDVDADAAPDESASQTLVTICKKSDGTYMVYAGDEPEDGEGGEPAGGGDEGEAGEGAPGAAEAPGSETGPEGIPCDTIGKALKAALDILQADESQGEGSAAENFSAGFEGGAAASPKRPMPAMKY